LVVGLRFTAGFFATGLFDVVVVLVVAVDLFCTTLFFAAGCVAAGPDVTRLECFARARTVLLGAASAGELSANEATSATSSALMVLRIINRPPRTPVR
jgi:hypothetical protein